MLKLSTILDEMRKLNGEMTDMVRDMVGPRVQKEVAIQAAKLQAIMEADHQRTTKAVEGIDQKLIDGMDLAKKEVALETDLTLKKQQKETDAKIEASESRLSMKVMAEVEDVVDDKLQGPLKDLADADAKLDKKIDELESKIRAEMKDMESHIRADMDDNKEKADLRSVTPTQPSPNPHLLLTQPSPNPHLILT